MKATRPIRARSAMDAVKRCRRRPGQVVDPERKAGQADRVGPRQGEKIKQDRQRRASGAGRAPAAGSDRRASRRLNGPKPPGKPRAGREAKRGGRSRMAEAAPAEAPIPPRPPKGPPCGPEPSSPPSRKTHERHRRDRRQLAPLIEHLAELRTRLIRSVAFLIGMVICFTVGTPIFNFLTAIRCAGLAERGQDCDLIFISPQEGFFVAIKISLMGGFMLAFPFIATRCGGSWRRGCTAVREGRVPAVHAGVALHVPDSGRPSPSTWSRRWPMISSLGSSSRHGTGRGRPERKCRPGLKCACSRARRRNI